MINKKKLSEKIESLFLFLEKNKEMTPSQALKAEFSFHLKEFQEEVGKIGEKEIPLLMEELKKPMKSKDLHRAYAVYYKLHEAEQIKNKWKIDIN